MNKLMTFLLCFSLSYAGERKLGGKVWTGSKRRGGRHKASASLRIEISNLKTGIGTYMLNFQDTLSDCPGYTNSAIIAHRLALVTDDESKSAYLQGDITIYEEITQNAMVVLTVYREKEIGRELFYVLDGVLCDHIRDVDMPWYPLFEAMGVQECPIEAKVYEIDRLALNTDHSKDMMTNEYVADYLAELVIEKKVAGLEPTTKKMSCYEMTLSVLAIKDE